MAFWVIFHSRAVLDRARLRSGERGGKQSKWEREGEGSSTARHSPLRASAAGHCRDRDGRRVVPIAATSLLRKGRDHAAGLEHGVALCPGTGGLPSPAGDRERKGSGSVGVVVSISPSRN